MAGDDKLLDTESGYSGTPIYVQLGWLGSFIFGVVGALLGATVGYFFGREENSIWGALIGFILCGIIGLWICGIFHYYKKHVLEMNSPQFEYMRFKQTGFADFDLFVTVHRCQNVMNKEGLMGFFGSKNDSFVKVQVGRTIDNEFIDSGTNPVKITCINKTNVFEECFRLRIARTDDTMQVALYDQDLVGEDLVGFVRINISNDIVDAHFPQAKGFQLKSNDVSMFAREVQAGTVVMSFTPGGNFPKNTLSKSAATTRHLEAHRLDQKRQEHKDELRKMKDTKASYGTWVAHEV